ncbi:MAG: DedA family protein [Desulfobacteraceae bacterium]|nr:DedA family protein [Desulfobacteraceae bacterium]
MPVPARDFLHHALNVLLHLDTHLGALIASSGGWIYGILFAVIFCETGLVVTPFLPGDSLLFAAGAFAATGALHPLGLLAVLIAAGILGDSVNFVIGSAIGPKVFHYPDSRFLRREHLERTHRFYEKHGGKTIILARFMPIIRTFAPFVAGVGSMQYRRFILFNVIGALLWVLLLTGGGYFFGNLPVVRRHFSLVVLVIIFLSVLPGIIEYVRHRREISR